MLILKIIEGPDKGKRFEFPSWEPQLIGRSSEALQMSDETCSRRHAELTPDKGTWFLRDLGSANGTYINGKRITNERSPIMAGDEIRVGSTVMVVGERKPDAYANPVRPMQEDFMDAIVESRLHSSDDSVIMAVPDPIVAATEHLRIIYELTRITTQALERELLLKMVMDLIFDEFRPERGFILIADSADAKPEPVIVKYNTPPRNQDEKQIHVSRTIINHVMKKQEGILSSNAMRDRRFSAGDSVQNYGIRSAICVPVIYHDHVYGVIHIDTSLINYTFTDSQLSLLTAIGRHTGLALSNVDLYRQQLQHERLAAMGETVAFLSHSIKNIMQGLKGGGDLVGMALQKHDLDLANQGWSILSRNLDRIHALTLNMLAYSKQRTVEVELTKLPELLDDVIQLIQPQCDRWDIVVMTDYDSDMAPVPVDPTTLHQALMNLLTNAVEAVEHHTGVITLACIYNPDTKLLEIRIGDNGPGIKQPDLAKIWTPFYSTKGLRGTGLGLAAAKDIIDQHGGRIVVESSEASGTTFSLYFPTDRTMLKDPSETVASHRDADNPQGSTPPDATNTSTNSDQPENTRKGYSPYDVI